MKKSNKLIAIIATLIVLGIGIVLAVHNFRRFDTGKPAPPPATTEHTHSYTAEVVEATCGHSGYTQYTCECGDSYRGNETKTLSHEYGDWKVVQEATLDNEGLQEKSCSRCNDRVTEVIPKIEEHEHIYSNEVVKPTCAETGYTIHTCTICNYKTTDTETAALGHAWSSWVVAVESTTNSVGRRTHSCSACGVEESEDIPMLTEAPHSHSYSSSVVEPTCTEDGYTRYTCGCGASYTDNYVSATGHLYGSWETTKQATTSETGERQCVCSRCSHVLKESIAMLAPEVSDKYSSIDPRIEIEVLPDGAVFYKCYPCYLVDTRTWGEPPSIQIASDGSFSVSFYQKDGTKKTFTVTNPGEGYTNQGVILEDGQVVFSLLGDFND